MRNTIKIIITTVVVATIGQYTMYLVDAALLDHQQNARREVRLRTRRKEYDLTNVFKVL